MKAFLVRVRDYSGFLPALALYLTCFVFPLALIVCYSFWTVVDYRVVHDWTADNYTYLAGVTAYVRTFLTTVLIAATVTVIDLLIAFPLAYWLSRYVPERWQRPLMALLVAPFLASYLLRIYAWATILDVNGLVNTTLQGLGLIDSPLRLLNSRGALIVVLAYMYFPFAALSLYAAVRRFDLTQLSAAMDLGASRGQAIRRIMLPQIRPGIMTGAIFVFIPVLGEYLVPRLIGGASSPMFGNVVATFFQNGQYTRGAASALLLTLVIVVLLSVFRRSLELRGTDDARR